MHRNKLNAVITSSDSIVCKETQIKISDEKIKSLLSKVYEIARKDASRFRLYNHYPAFFSVGFTIFLTIISSEFKSIGTVSGDTVHTIAIVLCIICIALCVILAIIKGAKSNSNTNDERDAAISEVLSKLMESSVTEKDVDYCDIGEIYDADYINPSV